MTQVLFSFSANRNEIPLTQNIYYFHLAFPSSSPMSVCPPFIISNCMNKPRLI